MLSLLRGLKRVFLSPGVTKLGGALFLGLENAHDQSTDSQRTPEGVGEIEVTGAGGLSATARSMCAGHDAHTEEAKFRVALSSESAVDEWPGSDCLHPRRGP